MAKRTVHEDVREVLPWFVNESLSEKETQRVLAHLRECPECRRERDELQALQEVVVYDDGTENGEYRSAFKKLIPRIDAAEANRASTREFDHEARFGGWGPYLAAAASLFVAVLFVGAIATDETPGDFTTLSAPPASIEGVPHRVAITFEQPIRAQTLRSALIETQSNIVSGPDDDGTYIVEVVVPDSVTDIEFIESMRNIDGVRYAAFDELHDTDR